MLRIGVLIFGLNVVMSCIASLVVDKAVVNESFFGMSLPIMMGMIGVMAYLFLYRAVSVSNWVWGLMGGCMGANLFERVIFGSVYDWIPCGIGMTNTADVGILVALVAVMWTVVGERSRTMSVSNRKVIKR